jgi:hypothetical protein
MFAWQIASKDLLPEERRDGVPAIPGRLAGVLVTS